MKKIILLIFCLSLINITFSQIDNADAEYLKILQEYTLNDDGSIDYHYVKSQKLLSHFSFHRLYGETFIIYNTDYQTLKINSAYTIMSDGKKVVTPRNAFNEVLPRFSNNAPAFNNIREMVVTHTGLEVGTVINLDYTISTKAGYYPFLMENILLSNTSPIKEQIIKVIIPQSKILHNVLLNIEGDPGYELINGKKIYTWTFNSIPANSKDDHQVSNHQDIPQLIFSTAPNLEYAYNSFVNQDAFSFTVNESMEKAVSDITNNETDELLIALELQKLVSNDINNINIPLEYTGYRCRTAVETWNSNQGTPMEKALLLTALLKKVDIVAEPIAIIPNNYFNEEVGDLSLFNNFLVRIKLNKHGEIYLAPNYINKQNLKFDFTEKTVLLIGKTTDKLKFTVGKPMLSSIIMEGEFDLLNPGKLLADIHIELKNNAVPYLSLYLDSSYIKSIVSGGISQSNIISSSIEKLTQQNTICKVSVEKDNPTTKQGGYLIFELPHTSNGVDSWHITVLPAERSAPLEIPDVIHEKYRFALVLPKDSKLVSKLQNIEIVNNVGSLLIKLDKSENEIIITREIKLSKIVIGINDYADFKEIMDIWNNSNYRKVIFKE
ncbi:MAG: DUF3857 domain-containing protein [Bacteroidetes bacterium]|nr:DUF3857 domain-containing protein [Bacteroidota bacterium]